MRSRPTSSGWHRAARALASLALVVAAAGAARAGQVTGSATSGDPLPVLLALQQPPRPAAQDEFVPVSELPAHEQLPAAPLLIAAYAFVWVALLVYVFMLWRRLGKVERELAGVARQVEERRRT
jgi:CcmD family protein